MLWSKQMLAEFRPLVIGSLLPKSLCTLGASPQDTAKEAVTCLGSLTHRACFSAYRLVLFSR
jgi:hypothetical protein